MSFWIAWTLYVLGWVFSFRVLGDEVATPRGKDDIFVVAVVSLLWPALVAIASVRDTAAWLVREGRQ